MKEEVFEDISERIERGEELVLCTVIETSGSTPQVPGAKMVVTSGGISSGTIGGGCGESTVKREATRLLVSGEKAKVVEVLLNDDIKRGGGDVCGGKMRVLIEKV